MQIPVVVLALGAPPCQETNPAFDGATEGMGSGSSTTSGPTTTVAMTTTTTSVGDSTGSDATTQAPSPTTSGPPPDPTTGDPPATGSGGSSDGGPRDPAYPPCMLGSDPECPRPYDHCYDGLAPDFTACSQGCTQDDDCPLPTSGDAEAVCAGPGGDECVLDCGGNAQCPDAMSCEQVTGNIRRCLWPA